MGKPHFSKIKKSSASIAEDKKFLWYHLSLPRMRPHGILTDPQAVSGPTRLRLLHEIQQSRSERNSTPRPSLPCTVRQLSGKADGCVLVFINALRIGMALSLALWIVEVKQKA